MKINQPRYLLCHNRSFALKPVYRFLFAAVVANFTLGAMTQDTMVAAQPVDGLIRAIIGQAPSTDGKTIRIEAGKWLKLARLAITDGNLPLASDYVARAERLNPQYDALTVRFEDTPQKVRTAIQVTVQAGSAPSAQVTVGDTSGSGTAVPQDPYSIRTEQAAIQSLAQQNKSQAMLAIGQGRNALRAGDLTAAIG
jgi:hypothetical protein